MSIAEAMIGEFTHESVGTRKMLERIPEDKLSWKPHEKSMTMGRLAGHLAEIPEWAATVVNDEVFDMVAANYKPKDFSSKKDILDYFDKNVGQAFKERSQRTNRRASLHALEAPGSAGGFSWRVDIQGLVADSSDRAGRGGAF